MVIASKALALTAVDLFLTPTSSSRGPGRLPQATSGQNLRVRHPPDPETPHRLSRQRLALASAVCSLYQEQPRHLSTMIIEPPSSRPRPTHFLPRVCLALLLSSLTAYAQSTNWQLTWSDEFDAPNGSSLDPKNGLSSPVAAVTATTNSKPTPAASPTSSSTTAISSSPPKKKS